MAKVVYVSGDVRKDAVEITRKEVRVTESRLLEAVYGEGWIPRLLRSVDVDELPTAAVEIERIANLYGDEMFEQAYGPTIQAREAVIKLLGMTPAQVAASGIVVANEAVGLEVEDDTAKARPSK